MSVSARYDVEIYKFELGHAAFADAVVAVGDQLALLSTLLERLDQALDLARRMVEPELDVEPPPEWRRLGPRRR